MTVDGSFRGFPTEAVAFLGELAANNDRAWFMPRKTVYETLVRAPMRQLVADLGPFMRAIDPAFDTNPRGGAVSRIHRDTRFSRDKTPYRPHQWIAFKRPARDWPNRPTFFMEFRPDGYGYGLGFYAATPATMARLRTQVAARPQAFRDALAAARNAGLALDGECYKRPRPQPAGLANDLADWYRFRNVHVVRERPIDADFRTSALVETLKAAFQAAAGLYQLWARLTEEVDAPADLDEEIES